MENIADYFGTLVFNDETQKQTLSQEVYLALKQTIVEGIDLDLAVANSVAEAMKDWAVDNGCTHYCHWFQPMTGITAEKHEAFISPVEGGKIILSFSGKELIKGESDASSFPSGGLRATFEARGYTAWDPSSNAFIKEKVLCIPTAYCSYSGEVLDKKTPLLRAMEVFSREATKIVKLFNYDEKVITTVGLEQEYFLIPLDLYGKRKDLIMTGRTLFGARTPKGQELDDHYFGALKTRVANYMEDLHKQLWSLGINAKTAHNEVAPCQHELAPIYCITNVAVDHNQLTMELMKKTAEKHNFACLFHEKPFARLNGSGKHNNWSVATENGINLLSPGKNPKENSIFLLFLSAVIKAVDDYSDLLSASAASRGNDARLGGNEAPPRIVSIYLGEDLTSMLESIAKGEDINDKKRKKTKFGVNVLPTISVDSADRNRTSPLAFTGNKFEFRMLGSSFSGAGPNIILNTIIAKSLKDFYVLLKDSKDLKLDVKKIVRDTYIKHSRILYNGNSYSKEWEEEAIKRGLINFKSCPETLDSYISEKNINLMSEFNILNKAEVLSRYEILVEEYSKTTLIEAKTMVDMVNKEILPSVIEAATSVATYINSKKAALNMKCNSEEKLLIKLSNKIDELSDAVDILTQNITNIDLRGSEKAHYLNDVVDKNMQTLRDIADETEQITAKKYWPFPTYADILFYV